MSYKWYQNGAKISGATANIYTISQVQTNNQGVYWVEVHNAGGSVTSSNATLTVLVPSAITTQPQNRTVTQGQNASFSVVASGTPPLNYQWACNGTALSGATSLTLTCTNVQTINAGSYTVVVTNIAGSITSSVAMLTVNAPPSITTQPQSQTVTLGQNTSFSVVASGTTPLSYQWACNGTALSGATSSTLTRTNVQTINAGSYTVVVTNSLGSVTSAVAALAVNVPPAITTQPQSQTVTLGQNASFSIVANGTAPLSYQWSHNGTALAGATTSALALSNVQTTDAGSYTVVVTNIAGSITSSGAALTVNVPPAITTQPQSQTVTLDQNASFSIVANGTAPLSYQWSHNGTALAGATASALALANVQTTDAGSYTVVVTNIAGSITSAVATLTVNVPPAITTQPQSQTVTLGQNASFSIVANGTAPLSCQWSHNGTALAGATASALALSNVQTTDAGSYTVAVTNIAGSITSSAAALTVNVPPAITTQPQSQTVTLDQNASFSIVATGTAPLSYQWSHNGSALAGATASALALSNVQTTDAGSYTVVVTNIAGSITSAVATLTVNVPPAITTQPQSQTVTLDQNASFSIVATGTAPLSYQWSFNGTAVSGTTNASLTLTNVQTTQAGSYTVVVTNNAGSITSAVATLTVTNPVVTLSVASGAGMTPSGFTLQFSVPVGVTYVILSSTDFQAWTPIATNVATTESVVFTDNSATNYPNRFYRTMVR
jgi:hypothetical protein